MTCETDHARANAASWMDSASEFVEAMNQETWDRLEELRDERDSCADTAYPMDCDDLSELERLEALLGEYESADDAREKAQESALSVEVRSGWNSPGSGMEAEDFMILLSTGGPALRIRGELDQHAEPSRAWLEYQDWGTPWTEYHGENYSASDLLEFCGVFYFGS